MKRGDLLRHLRAHGCDLLREGGHAGRTGRFTKVEYAMTSASGTTTCSKQDDPDSAPLHPGYSGRDRGGSARGRGMIEFLFESIISTRDRIERSQGGIAIAYSAGCVRHHLAHYGYRLMRPTRAPLCPLP